MKQIILTVFVTCFLLFAAFGASVHAAELATSKPTDSWGRYHSGNTSCSVDDDRDGTTLSPGVTIFTGVFNRTSTLDPDEIGHATFAIDLYDAAGNLVLQCNASSETYRDLADVLELQLSLQTVDDITDEGGNCSNFGVSPTNFSTGEVAMTFKGHIGLQPAVFTSVTSSTGGSAVVRCIGNGASILTVPFTIK